MPQQHKEFSSRSALAAILSLRSFTPLAGKKISRFYLMSEEGGIYVELRALSAPLRPVQMT